MRESISDESANENSLCYTQSVYPKASQAERLYRLHFLFYLVNQINDGVYDQFWILLNHIMTVICGKD
jgi:hypothetical protein